MTTKYEYPALEREYIEGGDDITLRFLARREGMASNSPISDYARKHNWEEKREQYREEASQRFIELTAAERGKQLARLEQHGITLLEAVLIQGAERVTNGSLEITAKDLLDAITKVQLLAGHATERTEGRTVHAHIVDSRSLEALEQLARRGLDGTTPGDQPKLLTG